jgi:hypothetical protein
MPKLRHRDIQDVIRLFDNELNMLGRISKVEKMKLRRKITNVVQPALSSSFNPDIVVSSLEEKLTDVIKLFMDPWGFKERLGLKLRELSDKEEGQWESDAAADRD